jgi:hypothetical protein
VVKLLGVLLVLLLVLGYSTVGAPDALAAGHDHLVRFRSCDAVLTAADFDDDLQEVSALAFIHGHDFTLETNSCTYAGLTEEGPTGLTQFTDGGLGVECLANILRVISDEKTPPPGGCYRISHSSLGVTTGSGVTKLLPKLRKGVKDKAWPSEYVRHVAHGIGNDAEWGYGDEENGYAYLQVLNATMTIETRGSISLLHILRLAAATL